MSIRLSVLGSGSSGNATVVWSDSTALLIDAGLSAREIGRRLEQVGLPLSALRAVCVTHEHSDHTAGLRVLNQRHGVALYGNAGTVDALREDEELRALPWKIFCTGQPFPVGDLTVHPFSVPHDAYEPVGFTITCGAVRAAVVTDIAPGAAALLPPRCDGATGVSPPRVEMRGVLGSRPCGAAALLPPRCDLNGATGVSPPRVEVRGCWG
jgi:phosphoribosyl 1,2-cyclic phosphodiesterase